MEHKCIDCDEEYYIEDERCGVVFLLCSNGHTNTMTSGSDIIDFKTSQKDMIKQAWDDVKINYPKLFEKQKDKYIRVKKIYGF